MLIFSQNFRWKNYIINNSEEDINLTIKTINLNETNHNKFLML